MSAQSSTLFPQHRKLLDDSAISPDVAQERGYRSVDTRTRLQSIGIANAGRSVPGLLIPTWGLTEPVGFQYRPDSPRVDDRGKTRKYETPHRQPNRLDIHPRIVPAIGDPTVPLIVTEGARKVDSLITAGAGCVIGLSGVWNWRGRNTAGGTVALADWHDVALKGRDVLVTYDHDVMRNPAVRRAAEALAGYLVSKGARVGFLWVPMVDGDEHTGVDDWLAAGGTLDELLATRTDRLHAPEGGDQTTLPAAGPPDPLPVDVPTGASPAERRVIAHDVFRRWLGVDYDTDVLDVVLATAAVERLDGDPLWLLVLSGSGNAKTETVMALRGCGAVLTSTIASEGALLSATAKQERAADATGGLLRALEPRGILVVKDVTSLLSSDRNLRGQVIAALREVHDGRWDRNVGTDGGRTLSWSGRIGVVGAVTTAWDRAHDVIAGMGDRFVIVRADSTTHRVAAGRRAIGNTGAEETMRAELAAVVGAVITGMDPAPGPVTDEETDRLLTAADLVTRARTGVDYDYRGDVIDAHAPEMPTRFAKELAQVMRGAIAVGITRHEAMRLAIRVARDSMPPLRLAILDDLAAHPWATTQDVRKRLGKPRATVDRQLQALHMLDVLDVDEEEGEWGGRAGIRWRYALADGIDPGALDPAQIPYQICDYLPLTPQEGETTTDEQSPKTSVHGGTHISGKGHADPTSLGPCITCGDTTHRYGDGASPLCDRCRTSTSKESTRAR